MEVVVEAGLDKYEDPPMKIFQYAVQQYTIADVDDFVKKILELESQHQRAMESVIKNTENQEKFIQEVGSHLGIFKQA